MHLYYIRHGQPLYGQIPEPLTEVGHKQAKATSKFLSQINFDYIFASPLMRAQQTAEYTANKLNKEILLIY